MVNDPGLVAIHQNGIVTGPTPVGIISHQDRAAALQQGLSRAIDKRPERTLCAPDHNLVRAFQSPTREVMRTEQVVVGAASHDAGPFDRLGTWPRGDRLQFRTRSRLSRLAIDLNHFQTGPVRAKGEIPLSVRTFHGIGIDRVIVVRLKCFPHEPLVDPAVVRILRIQSDIRG